MKEIPAGNPEALGNGQPTSTGKPSEKEEIDWEKRYKDSQKFIEETSVEAKRLKQANEALSKKVLESATVEVVIPDEVTALKHEDPDKWFQEVTRLQAEAKLEAETKSKALLESISNEAETAAEITRREKVLEAFNTLNPSVKVTDKVLSEDVPPRISNKLADGSVTFEQFLEEVKTYLTASRLPAGQEYQGDPSLNKVAGGEDPDPQAVQMDVVENYKKAIF